MTKGIIVSLCDYSGAWSRPFIDYGYTVVRVDPMHDRGVESTAGTLEERSGLVRRMPDGGLSLAMTAGQLRNWLDQRSVDGSDHRRHLAGLLGLGSVVFFPPVVGVLAAPPCTTYSGSGARWWPRHDSDGSRAASDVVVRDCLALVRMLKPEWWALENPVGRIARCVPELQESRSKLIFDPCDYAKWADEPASEAYTKRTVIWGDFDADLPLNRVEPVMIEKRRKDGTIVRGSWMWANLGGKSERTKALRSKTPQGFARAFAASQEVARECDEEAA